MSQRDSNNHHHTEESRCGWNNNNDDDDDEEEHRQHDQLPSVDDILVDRGKGRVLASGSGSIDGPHDHPVRNSNNGGDGNNKKGGCLWNAVKLLVVAMLVVSGFAIAFLVGEQRGSEEGAVVPSTGQQQQQQQEQQQQQQQQQPPWDNTNAQQQEAGNTPGIAGSTTLPPTTSAAERLGAVTRQSLVDEGFALSGGTEFDDSESYQSKALKTLVENGIAIHDDPSSNSNSNSNHFQKQKLAQRYALLCLYYSTNGVRTDVTDEQFGYGTTPRWHNKDVPSPWKFQWEDDECDWSGVVCDRNDVRGESTFRGLVERIELVNHLLTGYLPEELKLLNGGPIRVLDFSDNRGLGQGGFPSVFSGFDDLESIGLRGTSFVGAVPKELCERGSIRNIFVDCNDLDCECCESCSRWKRLD
eukprot:CAMPEP_0201120044 /NCGR_PEP_ID=MMETSP0850-20130426/4141_1 /ASSEMBLY_ACC=CAM_ASM_000622 /TAXON_ID=183588 /ORGANISM="Pseudo-nitzschia fraudulenta, Strain WWA7" /LENGTH=413 /DNA_ID=CAMNT_0047386023 /DNA_START=277 /DNA_END=1518 /DNA_ORIENTATION=-